MKLIQNISNSFKFCGRAGEILFGLLNRCVAVHFRDEINTDAFFNQRITKEPPVRMRRGHTIEAGSLREADAKVIKGVSISVAL